MPYKIASPIRLPFGTSLIFHHDDSLPLEPQVGALSFHQQLEAQRRDRFSEYYDGKFNSRVEIHVWSKYLPNSVWPTIFPGAECYDRDSNGRIRINILYDPAAKNFPYCFTACLSHEIGHAYHWWAECFKFPEFKAWFERTVSQNHTVYGNYFPWGNDNAYEQFANWIRFVGGDGGTRGVSGVDNGGSDPVVSGFIDPKIWPIGKKAAQLLPETSAYWKKFGLRSNSLSWQGSPDSGYWQFMNDAGAWMKHSDYWLNGWFQWSNGNWYAVSPQYVRD